MRGPKAGPPGCGWRPCRWPGTRIRSGFAAEFSGSERTVAEYLLAEVLERQSEEVRLLLLRTSVAERVNGELAGLLTGEPGGERILQELEEANAFVVSLDARRSWFRYHRLFADLLQLELRRTAPGEVPALHGAAAGWFAEHGFPVEAVRHAQAAQDWGLAARLLAGHWLGLVLDGQAATAHELLAGFPAGVVAADVELTALTAAAEMRRGSLEEAERYLAAVTAVLASVPTGQRDRVQVLLVILRLFLARRRGDLPAAAQEAERLLAPAGAPGTAQPEADGDLRALALINLGIAEVWTARLAAAGHHLEQGTALAHRIGRPFLEVKGLAHSAAVASRRSVALAVERSRQAIELARRHGWSEEPVAGFAYAVLGATLVAQGRLAEAEPWFGRAERRLRAEAEPAAGQGLCHVRGLLELARGRPGHALAAFQAAEQLAGLVVTPNMWATQIRAYQLQTLVRLGETGRAEAALAGMDQHERATGEMHVTLAVLRLAQHHPQAAATALAPVLNGSAPMGAHPGIWAVQAFLLEAIVRDALGDLAAAGRALEHALHLAEPNGMLLPFLLCPVPGLLQRHSRHRTAHAALITQILDLLAAPGKPLPPPGQPQRLREPLTGSETRVLRYLPASLTVPELAGELHLSVNTVRTHMRHIYTKLGAHRRHEAVERARALGLLAPSPHRPFRPPACLGRVPARGLS
jgi:LuxR family transcriptional regulator, maltose regulon positive regulatory protein